MNLDLVEKIADVVLYEGYLLYPYRHSALKNQQRWTFGGVYPRSYSETSSGDEPWTMRTQCLVIADDSTRLTVKARFLHVIDRQVVATGHGQTAAQGQAVEELRVGQQVYRPGEEAIKREVLIGASDPGTGVASGQCLDQERPLRLVDLIGQGRRWAIDVPAGTEQETLRDGVGQVAGALIRTWQPLQGAVEITADLLDTSAPPGRLYRLTISIVNTTPLTMLEHGQGAALQPRQAALRQTFVSTHTILRVSDGQFVSLLEPEEEYQEAAQGCANSKTWPVLVGEQGERHTILSSPIILYDYPEVAPESPGNLFDGTEIDELLTISIMALTDAEKQEMRESEPRARELLERTEALLPDQLSKLHGAVRSLQPVRRQQG